MKNDYLHLYSAEQNDAVVRHIEMDIAVVTDMDIEMNKFSVLRTQAMKKVSGLEADIKIKEAEAATTEEFMALKNDTLRSAYFIRETAAERAELAKAKADLENFTNEIFRIKDVKESAFASIKAHSCILDNISTLLNTFARGEHE